MAGENSNVEAAPADEIIPEALPAEETPVEEPWYEHDIINGKKVPTDDVEAEARKTRHFNLNKVNAIAVINAIADQIRGRYTTPTEKETYENKRREMARWDAQVAAGEEPSADDYIFLKGEVARQRSRGKSDMEPADVVATWRERANEIDAIASRIDQARLTAKEDIKAAKDQAELNKAADAFHAVMAELPPPTE